MREANGGKASSPRYYIKVLGKAIEIINALGAVRAARELGREQYTGIVGNDLSPAERVLAEIKDAGSPFIATISVFPEEHGKKILSIILRWLRNEQVPPTTYTETALVVRENVDEFLVRTRLP